MALFKLFRDAFAGLPRAAWLLALVVLVNRAGTMVLPFLAIYISRELGFSMAFVGWALGAYGLGTLLGTWVSGRLCDLINARKIMGWSLAGGALCLWSLEFLHSKPALLLGLLLVAAVSEAVRPAQGVILTEHCQPKDLTRGFALMRLAVNLGTSLGPAVGGMLAMIDYAWLFRLDGLTCFLSAIMLVFVPRNGPFAHQPDAEESKAHKNHNAPWRDPVFMGILLVCLPIGLLFFQIWATYAVFLQEGYGLSEAHYGGLMSLNGLLIISFEMVLSHLLANARELRVAAIGSVFLAFGLGILPLGNGMVIAVVSLVLWTIGEMLIAPFLSGYVARRAPSSRRGDYLGWFNMSFALAHVFGPMAGTYVFESAGWSALWFGCGLVGLAAAGAFLVILHLDQPKPAAVMVTVDPNEPQSAQGFVDPS